MQNETIPISTPNARPLRYISICSGIEAATVAFHPLGWKPLAFAEIEAFPSAVLAHHYPSIPNLGDITRFHDWPEELLAECDLLVGGPPCQAFSIAGQRNSLADSRGNLTLTYVQLINHIDSIRRNHGRPPVIALYENVPGLYSTKDNAFGSLVGALCGQDAPVETETGKWPTTGIFWGEKRRVGYRTLDAQFFGLAQRRRRCFVLAVPNELVERVGDRADPAEILSIPESLRGDSPPSRETGQRPAPTLSARTKGGGGLGTDFDCDGGLVGSWWDGGQLSQTLDAVLSKGQTMPEKNRFPAVLHPVPILEAGARTGISTDDPRAGIGIGEPADPMFTLQAAHSHAVAFAQNTRDEVRLIAGDGQAVGALAAEAGMKQQSYIACFKGGQGASARSIGYDEHVVPTLPSADSGSNRTPVLMQAMQVRRLTPRECERLQGFSDDYTLVPYRGKLAADGPRYKALGNSMAVPCMSWIGQRIQMVRELQLDMAA